LRYHQLTPRSKIHTFLYTYKYIYTTSRPDPNLVKNLQNTPTRGSGGGRQRQGERVGGFGGAKQGGEGEREGRRGEGVVGGGRGGGHSPSPHSPSPFLPIAERKGGGGVGDWEGFRMSDIGGRSVGGNRRDIRQTSLWLGYV